MPSCSANDMQLVNSTPPTAGGATMNAAAADAVTDSGGPVMRGNGCLKERCRNELEGGAPCPPGSCQRGKDGEPTHWHARPPCPDHDKGDDRPWRPDAPKDAPLPPAVKRQRVVVERLAPMVHAWHGCLRDLEADLEPHERGHAETLRAWLEKLEAERVAFKK
jgi:hypothetical protein